MSDLPFDLSLLPASAKIEAGGGVSVGGVALVELAARYGTPLYVYDEGELRARCREYRAHFGDGVVIAQRVHPAAGGRQIPVGISVRHVHLDRAGHT